jgi:hypothetical protein
MIDEHWISQGNFENLNVRDTNHILARAEATIRHWIVSGFFGAAVGLFVCDSNIGAHAHGCAEIDANAPS